MRRIVFAVLISLSSTLIQVPANASTDGCPDTWLIDTTEYPNQELAEAKKRLGVNMAIAERAKVIEYKGPLGVMPAHNVVIAPHKVNPLGYLYSDSKIQTEITVELRGCTNKGTFKFKSNWINPELRIFQVTTAVEFANRFPDLFSDFKQQDLFAGSVRDLEKSLQGRLEYPLRIGMEQIPFGLVDAYFQRLQPVNARIGRFYTFALTPKCLNQTLENSVELVRGSGECKFALGATVRTFAMEKSYETTYIFEPFTINLPSKQSITCVKGKTTKKVTAVNPKCPAGYKKK
jgi:hypothetical protein